MAVIQHIIHYDAKNFDALVALAQCFIDANPAAVVDSFQTEFENNKWEASISYRAELADVISCIIPVGFLGRIECLYNAELLGPTPTQVDYTCWVNGKEVPASSTVLVTTTETLRITFQSLPFAAGDDVELSFCNIAGMNVSTVLCASFSRITVVNNLV